MSAASLSPVANNKLKITLLGPPLVQWGDNPLGISRRSVRALLYFLASQTIASPREKLCLLFWPDISEAGARRNLTRLLAHLRMQLPEPHILVSDEEMVYINPTRLWCDVIEFRKIVASAGPANDNLEQAVQLRRGPFLDGFYLPQCCEFENWSSQERLSLDNLYLQALGSLVQEETARQHYQEAVHFARLYLVADELAEEVHRALISLYALNGDRSQALRQYERCVTVLERELGTDPLPETKAVYQAVLEGKLKGEMTEVKPRAEMPWTGQLRLDVPLVGRAHDLSILDKGLSTVMAGPSQVFLISGEPGIGKTRLLHDMLTKSGQRARGLFGSGDRGEMSLPYHPVVEALHSFPLTCPASLPPVWLSEVSRLLPEINDLKPGLPPPLSLKGDEARIRLYEALCQFILALRKDYGPLLICLDNLHWFDQTSLGWLTHFCRQYLAKSTGILLIATCRSEDIQSLDGLRDSLSGIGLLNEIQLEGLTQANISELLGTILSGVPEKELLAARLKEATGGNPFFILETLRTLEEENQSASDAGQWKDLPLPQSVRSAVSRRLGRLDAVARQVLEAAAVLGAQFMVRTVRLTAGRNDLETADGLDTLVNRQLITRVGDDFCFSHDLVRKAVLAAMSPMRFKLLNNRAGKARVRIEPEAVGTIAHHFEISGDWDKALHYSFLAAQKAEALFAWQEANALYDRMLELLRQLDPALTQAEHLRLRAKIFPKLVQIQQDQGDLPARNERLKQMEERAAASKDKYLELVLLILQSRFYSLDGKIFDALAAAQRGMALADELKDRDSQCRLLIQTGFMDYFLGQPEQAVAKLEKARILSEECQDLELCATVWARLGFVKCHFGKYHEALACYLEAHACYVRSGNHYLAATQLVEIGATYAFMARYAEAMTALSEILELAQKNRLRIDEANALLAFGALHRCQGELEPAVHSYNAALDIYYAIQSSPHMTSIAECEIGKTLYQSGDFESSLTWLEKAYDRARGISFFLRVADVRVGMALVETARGQLDCAREHLAEGLSIARHIHCVELTIAGLAASASLERRAGNYSAALAHVEEGIEVSHEIDLPGYEMWMHTEAGLVLLEMGAPVAALEHTRHAVSLVPRSSQDWITHAQVFRAHESVLTKISD